MKYLCVECNYIYDESIGDMNEGIAPGTKIYELSFCPNCGEIDTFEYIKEEIIYIEENTFDKYEMEHFIDIEKNKNKLIVSIGNNTHPMGENHRITWVGLFDYYGDLIEEIFLGIDFDDLIIFEDFDLDEFEIRLKCSKHNIFARKFA